MNLHHKIALHCGVVVLFSFAAIGCQSELEQLPEVSVNVPEQFEQDGVAWQKQPDVQPPDKHCLRNFFARNEGLAGSPEFEGQPVVFASGKTDRRYYWLNSAVDGMRWQCVELKRRRFSVSDGTENPFESPADITMRSETQSGLSGSHQ